MTRHLSEIDHKQAKSFLLKTTSYDNDRILPDIFDFQSLIKNIDPEKINSPLNKSLKNFVFNHVSNEKVREIEVINPVLYVIMVELVTSKETWKHIRRKLMSSKIEIIEESYVQLEIHRLSEPIVEESFVTSSYGTLIYSNSIQLELLERSNQSYAHFDIKDFYNSINHSTLLKAIYDGIPSNVLIDKIDSSKNLDEFDSLGEIGTFCKLFKIIRSFRSTGIPTFSTLMSLLSEVLLNAIDYEISQTPYFQNGHQGIEAFEILRYKDDYYVFGISKEEVTTFEQNLDNVLAKFSLQLNNQKTKFFDWSLENIYPKRLSFYIDEEHTYYSLIQLTKEANSINTEFLSELLNRVYQKELLKTQITNSKKAESIIRLLIDISQKSKNSRLIIAKLSAAVIKYTSIKSKESGNLTDLDPATELTHLVLELIRNSTVNDSFFIHFFSELKRQKVKSKFVTPVSIIKAMSSIDFLEDITFEDIFTHNNDDFSDSQFSLEIRRTKLNP